MPAEITHIIFADHFLKKHPEFERKNFIIGTLFPDIRYLGVVKREHTHPNVKNLSDITNSKDSFEAGWRFHVYLDNAVNHWYFNELGEKDDATTRAYKFYQDVVVYEEIKNWNEIIALLKPDNTFPLGITNEARDTWYAILREYFQQKPTTETMSSFFNATAFPKDQQADVIQRIQKLEKDPKASAALVAMTQKTKESEIF